jgi:hypothetical protein
LSAGQIATSDIDFSAKAPHRFRINCSATQSSIASAVRCGKDQSEEFVAAPVAHDGLHYLAELERKRMGVSLAGSTKRICLAL